jgi:hypothetical protein
LQLTIPPTDLQLRGGGVPEAIHANSDVFRPVAIPHPHRIHASETCGTDLVSDPASIMLIPINRQSTEMNITFPQKLRTASLNSPGQLRHCRDVPASRHEASDKLSRLPGYFSNMIRLSPLITLDGKIQHPASTYNYHLCTCVYALRRSLTTLMLTYLRPIHH